jgi:DNA-binding CsgD family transcriptional regulator
MGKVRALAEQPPKGRMDRLSAQERRVLALVAEGKTNKEIGVELGLSDKTVKNYLANLMDKLQLNRRSQAAAFFAQHGARQCGVDLYDKGLKTCLPALPSQYSSQDPELERIVEPAGSSY